MAGARGRVAVVGLGFGSRRHLTLGAWEELNAADAVFLRTGRHPLARYLRRRGLNFTTFDALYRTAPSFEEVYRLIADRVLDEACRGLRVAYAVPGHPRVAERSVELLLQGAPGRGVEVTVVPGLSFLDGLWGLLSLDPTSGVQVLDAASLSGSPPDPRLGLVVAQVYDRRVAGEVKLALLGQYPANFPVTVVRAAGVTGRERCRRVALEEIDRLPWVDHLTALYLPPLASGAPGEGLGRGAGGAFARLVGMVRHLRGPRGCPWDRAQTPSSLRPFIIEEAYETVAALEAGDSVRLKEELGDLLLQVVLQGAIAEEERAFDLEAVIEGLLSKLVHRHPHVFGPAPPAGTSREVLARWEEIKGREKEERGLGLLDDVPSALPALIQAARVQGKASGVGFDWDRADSVLAKVREELAELERAWAKAAGSAPASGGDAVRAAVAGGGGARAAVEAEAGDLLFSVVNLCRFLEVDPEMALRAAVERFRARFRYMEERARESGRPLASLSLAEMDALWEEAKCSLPKDLRGRCP
ncbi:MAG: nucleoside triphosphate pyrophosphohydrolase [Acetobacteraceae bacterium]|nr:nucleoside triphosphate pyrophosphohydrolase [Acetobacteraceae bacterium]